ncbi:MAG: hypothetical protein AAFZ07_19600 [Actinomycetota bacterium]
MTALGVGVGVPFLRRAAGGGSGPDDEWLASTGAGFPAPNTGVTGAAGPLTLGGGTVTDDGDHWSFSSLSAHLAATNVVGPIATSGFTVAICFRYSTWPNGGSRVFLHAVNDAGEGGCRLEAATTEGEFTAYTRDGLQSRFFMTGIGPITGIAPATWFVVSWSSDADELIFGEPGVLHGIDTTPSPTANAEDAANHPFWIGSTSNSALWDVAGVKTWNQKLHPVDDTELSTLTPAAFGV